MALAKAASCWLAVALLASSLVTANSALLAVDLGAEYLKVCLVKPGRTPISIAVNEMSKRKSPALVGFAPDGARLIGEEAFSFAVRYPDTIFQRARDLLGKDASDPTIKRMLDAHALPYTVTEDARGNAALRVSGNATVSAEELVASLLYYARSIAEANAGGPVPDAVITVPAFYGQRQRQALMDAASLAGLNVLGLINTHTAAALQYGIERDFANKTQTVILYDMGSSSTSVALVKYSTYYAKEGGKKATINQLEVKDVDWDADLGANDLDTLLARHFAAQFQEKAKVNVDITSVPKAMAKMKRNVRRTKEMLSANSGAPCSVEELYDGKDFQSHITRDEFEVLAGDFFKRAAGPLERLLARNNLTSADLDAVELLGGGTRVPRLQATLSEVLGGRNLDRHLDADEAAVFGAGLFAANLSTSFRLRKFGMVDLAMYGISMSIDHIVMADAPQDFQKVRNLLPYMKKVPNKRVVKLELLSADPLKVSLAYNTSTHHGLPPGVSSPELAEFTFTGVDTAISRYNTSGVVTLRFEADTGGLLKLDKAEAVVEYTVMEEKIVEVPAEGAGNATNATTTDKSAAKDNAEQAGSKDEGSSAGADSTNEDGGDGVESGASEGEGDAKDAADSEEEAEAAAADGKSADGTEQGAMTATTTTANANDTAAGKNATTVKRIQVPKKKIAKVALTVSGGWRHPALAANAAALAASRAKMSGWATAEALKRELAKARNDLESYIIATKETLESDELVAKVSTEEQREALRTLLTDEEDWLYMEADDSGGAEQFRTRLRKLQDMAEPIKKRADELQTRPDVVAKVRSDLELKRAVAKAWPDTKPWISDKEREAVNKALDELDADLTAKEAAQAKKQLHEEPAFTSQEVAVAWERVEKFFTKTNNKRKPKPPPEPKPDKADKAEGEDAKSGKESKPEDSSSSSTEDSQQQQQQQDNAGSGGQQQQQQQQDGKAKDSKWGWKKGSKDKKEDGKGTKGDEL